jgi:hypothetical protein
MVNGVDLAVDPTSLVLLHSKLIYSGFFSWQTILTNKSSFMDLCWWVHKTNLVYKTPLIAHFLVLFGQHIALFESRHKHHYLPKWHQKSCTEHELPRMSPTNSLHLFSFNIWQENFGKGKETDIEQLYSHMNIENRTIFLVFYHHSLECHKYIRITFFWVKQTFQSDQHVSAVMSQASRLHASIALVMFLQ